MYTNNKYLESSGNEYTFLLLVSRGSRWTFCTYPLIEIAVLSKTSHVKGGPGNSVCWSFEDQQRVLFPQAFKRIKLEVY